MTISTLLYNCILNCMIQYFQTIVYCGKPADGEGPYYIAGIANIVKELVVQLKRDCPLGGRNISMDRLYGSVEIEKWLLEHAITATCTMITSRMGMPAEVKDVKNRALLSNTLHFEQVY